MKLDRDRINEARPTWFEGILYRSQTEARWAVFLRCMDIPFEYEERHFTLGGMFYLPDFWLPKQNCWLEIKGPFPTREEKEKARRLAAHEQRNVYVCFGDIPEPEDDSWYTGSCVVFFPDGRDDDTHWWCECFVCGTLGLEFEGSAASLTCGCLRHATSRSDVPKGYRSTRLLQAYLVAIEAIAYRRPNDHDLLIAAGLAGA